MNQLLSRFGVSAALGVFLLVSPVSAETVEVGILRFKFTPQQVTVKPGDTVRWVNQEKRQYHSVWFGPSASRSRLICFLATPTSASSTRRASSPIVAVPTRR